LSCLNILVVLVKFLIILSLQSMIVMHDGVCFLLQIVVAAVAVSDVDRSRLLELVPIPPVPTLPVPITPVVTPLVTTRQ